MALRRIKKNRQMAPSSADERLNANSPSHWLIMKDLSHVFIIIFFLIFFSGSSSQPKPPTGAEVKPGNNPFEKA